ncbi:MAG: glycerophosphodiester phosphodiesterase [Longimicrobiales bacterium]
MGRSAWAALADPPHLIAHRGGAGLAPENTLPAFTAAVDQWQSDLIELDVRATADGHCVVIHDPTVDRTTNGQGDVAALTLAALRELDAGHRFTRDDGRSFPFRGQGVRVPTIDEVFDAVGATPLIVEVKEEPAQRPLLEAIRRHGAESRVMHAGERHGDRSLFHRQYAGPASASAAQIKRFYAAHVVRLARLWPIRFDAFQVPETHEGRRVVTPRLIEDLRARGVIVHVWTVNEEGDMHRLLDWGVDGLVTDYPDRLARVLHERVGRPLPPALAGV